MGHGGMRAGSGAKRGGISQTKRVLLTAINRGLEMAGRKRGLEGSSEEVATEAAACIVCDMVIAGEGRFALALLAQAAPKADSGEEGGKSALTSALERMTGKKLGPEKAQTISTDERAPIESTAVEESLTGSESERRAKQPISFLMQGQLLPAYSPSMEAGFPEQRTTQGDHTQGTPHPPLDGSHNNTHLETENFEKNSPAN